MHSPKPAPTPDPQPAGPVAPIVVVEETSAMTRAVAATVRKHVSAAPANRRKRRLLNRESAIRRSLVGAKGMR